MPTYCHKRHLSKIDSNGTKLVTTRLLSNLIGLNQFSTNYSRIKMIQISWNKGWCLYPSKSKNFFYQLWKSVICYHTRHKAFMGKRRHIYSSYMWQNLSPRGYTSAISILKCQLWHLLIFYRTIWLFEALYLVFIF